MNVYIDLGVGDGDTILQFRNWRHLLDLNTMVGQYDDWMVYGFEPNPELEREWIRHVKEDTIIEQKAAWIEDGSVELSVNETWYKSSVMPEKQDYHEGRLITVPCFDFSEWIKQFVNHTVLLKVDTEGAELPILTKMIEDGTDNIPMMTFVEWHDGKMPTYKSNKHEILANFRGNIVEWR